MLGRFKVVGRPILFSLGILSFILGFIGIFLPLLPTTPFMILAAFLFNKSSPRMHAWILSLPKIGPIIMTWEKTGVIEPRVKKIATASIIVLFSFSLYVAPVAIWLKILISSIGVSVIVFIWSRPSFPPQ